MISPLASRAAIKNMLGRSLPVDGTPAAEFVLLDRFVTPESAPLATPRTCEPGPGTLTILDTYSRMDIASQILTVVGVIAAGDRIVETDGFSLTAGKCLAADFGNVSGNNYGHGAGTIYNTTFGWILTTNQFITVSGDGGGFVIGAGVIGIKNVNSLVLGALPLSSDNQRLYCISRADGGFFAVRQDGLAGDYLMEWVEVYDNIASVAYPKITFNGTLVAKDAAIENLRIMDLGAPFDTYNGLATDELAGSISAATGFTHEADAIFIVTVTTLPSSGTIDIRFRVQDANNYWNLQISSTGYCILQEVVAGTPTTRTSPSGKVSAGGRIGIRMRDETIWVLRASSSTTFLINVGIYISAANFKTETTGEVSSLGTGGALEDLLAYPIVLGATAIAELERFD
jgi:hypothetical protein